MCSGKGVARGGLLTWICGSKAALTGGLFVTQTSSSLGQAWVRNATAFTQNRKLSR
jgi:hypothetical protein